MREKGFLGIMKYEPLPASFYEGARVRLMEQLQPNSIAILNANDVYPTNADGTMPFCQNSDLFYLTGVDQEESILLLYPDAPDASLREVLFVRETNEHIAIWEGAKLTKEQATSLSGIKNVKWLQDFEAILGQAMKQADRVYLNRNEHLRADNPVDTRDNRFTKKLKKAYPLHQYERLAPITGKLRQIKHEEELVNMRKAAWITEQGVRRLLEFIKPGVGEWEIEAELAHQFMKRGSRRFAFQSIIASGKNSCVLHYVENDQICQDGDLVLMDIGAEYGNYNCDITRVFPINGKFTPRQRQVYEAVKRVGEAAFEIMRPGIFKKEYEQKVGKIMEKELIGLGLLTAEDVANQNPAIPAYRRYFMHGCSHFLGLDVHDVGEANPIIAPGMVYTIEPGIYIREEGIGIRLENDIYVGETENVNLTAAIPIEPDEIEQLMAK